jgi:hypothetical protein
VIEDVAHFVWVVIVQSDVDTCHFWPITCGHVAQPFGATCHCITGLIGLVYYCVKCMGPRGLTPGPLP